MGIHLNAKKTSKSKDGERAAGYMVFCQPKRPLPLTSAAAFARSLSPLGNVCLLTTARLLCWALALALTRDTPH